MCDVGIDPDAPDWPYQQVAARIRDRIRAGELGPRLPSYHDLANEMGVAPMTVQRAIRVLVDEGLVRTVPGRGTFVAKRPRQPLLAGARRQAVSAVSPRGFRDRVVMTSAAEGAA